MASSQISETPATEQVITEIFAKTLHIVLESRSPYVSSRNYSIDRIPSSPSSSSGSRGPRDKWFNLALRECPAALENSDYWRQSNLEPLIIDIILVNCASGTEKLLERWVVQYETRKQPGTSRKSKKHYYRGGILLLRSLYLLVRLLPAYNLFRDINSSSRICPLGLSHKIQPFVNPLTRSEDAEMRHLSLAPIETPFGRIIHSVSYLPVLDDIGIRTEPSTPLSTEFIPDYVGSPTTDPLKWFQALPSGGSAAICVQPSRRHSWISGTANLFPASLPTHLDSHSPSYKQRPSIPVPPPELQKRKKGPEGSCLSPVSSPQKAYLSRCDSAPPSRGSDPHSNPCSKAGMDSVNNELVQFGEVFTGTSRTKEISRTDDIRYQDGIKLSLGSGSWVRGSRVSFHDLNEDSDASYPFASDAFNRTRSDEGERSQGAIVGALLQMLKTASKLQIGFEKSDSSDQNPNPPSSGSRTAADALQELRDYKHMRDSIVSQSDSHPSEPDPEKETNSEEEKGKGKGKGKMP